MDTTKKIKTYKDYKRLLKLLDFEIKYAIGSEEKKELMEYKKQLFTTKKGCSYFGLVRHNASNDTFYCYLPRHKGFEDGDMCFVNVVTGNVELDEELKGDENDEKKIIN